MMRHLPSQPDTKRKKADAAFSHAAKLCAISTQFMISHIKSREISSSGTATKNFQFGGLDFALKTCHRLNSTRSKSCR